MANNLDIFRKDFLYANTWAQRKDGVPLDLLDNLSPEELKVAEAELISSANLSDKWPILGLAHIKSATALQKLYALLGESTEGMKVTIAYSIFQICGDPGMVNTVLDEVPEITSEYELIDILYLLPAFKNEHVTSMLNSYRDHKEYLIAYNAAQALGLSTDEIVEKARQQNEKKNS